MNGWADTFLFWDAVIVTLLCLADFLIGKEGRAAMRERIGEWWLHVEGASFTGLVAEDARAVIRFFHKVFGESELSFKFIFRSVALSASILFISMVSVTIINEGSVDKFLDEFFFTSDIDYFWRPFLIYTPINGILDWLSLYLTILFLGIMARSDRPLVTLGVIGLDVIVAVLIGVVVIVISRFLSDYFGGGGFLSGIEYAFYGAVVLFTSLLPTLIHFLVASVFLLSKLLRPIVQKPLALVLLRFHESDKGALTLLAIMLGTLSKLVQQGIKVYA